MTDRPYQPNAFAPHRPSNLSQTNSSSSPFSPPQRSATLPLTTPSPQAKAQDSAVQIFPPPRTRSATPTTSVHSIRPFELEKRNQQPQQDSFGVFAPLSPKRPSGDDFLQRLKTIAPGPFDTNQDRGHRKNLTSGSSMEDFIRSPKKDPAQNHFPQPSGTSTYHSRDPSQSSTTGTVQRRRSVDKLEPAVPGDLTSTSRSEPADAYLREPLPGSKQYAQKPPSIAQIGRSQTSPVHSDAHERYPSIDETFQEPASVRSQKKLLSHQPKKPSVAAAIRPLDEIGSMSSFKPSRSLRGRKGSSPMEKAEPLPATRAGTRSDERYHNAPPVPRPTRALDFGIGNPYHLSTESNSSSDSSGSDVRTASSRSTPPLTESPQGPKREPDTSRLDNLMSGFQPELDTTPVIEQSVPSRGGPPPSFSRPTYTRPPEPWQDRGPIEHRPEIQGNRNLADSGLTPSEPLQQGTVHGPPAPAAVPTRAPPWRARKPQPAGKGSCRGCGALIFGKSVSSADGRLTGRYHKPCFVCRTCKEPFQTADFYVLSNQPYCARHYHQLNDSLCTTCDQGIEGQYLETEGKQKYHPHCFTCQVGSGFRSFRLLLLDAQILMQDCRRPLQDDYFEVNGRTYCEQDAFRAAQRTPFLGPGRRHPERRTTRLMMM